MAMVISSCSLASSYARSHHLTARVYEGLLGSKAETDRTMASLGLPIVRAVCNLCKSGVSPAQSEATGGALM